MSIETENNLLKANFAKKEQVGVPQSIKNEMAVQIAPLYYWEDVYKGKSQLMTMAFQYKGMNFGYSYPIEDENVVKKEMLRRKLFARMKETLDVLTHHGDAVLDSQGQIDVRKVNDQEAIRFKHDQYWDRKVAAFDQLVKVYPITKNKAATLGLIDNAKNIPT